MTDQQIENGISCYADRVTYVFTDGQSYETGESIHSCPAAWWLAGVKQPDHSVTWL